MFDLPHFIPSSETMDCVLGDYIYRVVVTKFKTHTSAMIMRVKNETIPMWSHGVLKQIYTRNNKFVPAIKADDIDMVYFSETETKEILDQIMKDHLCE